MKFILPVTLLVSCVFSVSSFAEDLWDDAYKTEAYTTTLLTDTVQLSDGSEISARMKVCAKNGGQKVQCLVYIIEDDSVLEQVEDVLANIASIKFVRIKYKFMARLPHIKVLTAASRWL